MFEIRSSIPEGIGLSQFQHNLISHLSFLTSHIWSIKTYLFMTLTNFLNAVGDAADRVPPGAITKQYEVEIA